MVFWRRVLSSKKRRQVWSAVVGGGSPADSVQAEEFFTLDDWEHSHVFFWTSSNDLFKDSRCRCSQSQMVSNLVCVCMPVCVPMCYYLKACTRTLRPNWWLSVSSWMQLQCRPPPALALWPRKWRLLHRRVWPWRGSGWRTIKGIFPRGITTTLAGQMSCSRMKYWGLYMTLSKCVCMEVSVGVALILIFLNGRKGKSVCAYYTLLCQEVTRIQCPQLV